jgi:hypothetical protein
LKERLYTSNRDSIYGVQKAIYQEKNYIVSAGNNGFVDFWSFYIENGKRKFSKIMFNDNCKMTSLLKQSNLNFILQLLFM